MSGHKPWAAIKRKGGITPEQYLAIAKFCAEEVGRQYAGYGDCKEACLAVGWMIEAWMYALYRSDMKLPITVEAIEEWGRLIEPEVNANGFRKTRIYVGDSEGTLPHLVPGAMLLYVDKTLPDLAHDPDHAYLEFEKIHPFGDGNGRTGKIIFNWLKGTLLAPGWPYNFWGISNP